MCFARKKTVENDAEYPTTISQFTDVNGNVHYQKVDSSGRVIGDTIVIPKILRLRRDRFGRLWGKWVPSRNS